MRKLVERQMGKKNDLPIKPVKAKFPKSLIYEPPEIMVVRWDENAPDVPGTGHLHWVIQAFQDRDEDGVLKDVVTIEVEAPSEEEAIWRAMKIISRNFYRVSHVRESCSHELKNHGNS